MTGNGSDQPGKHVSAGPLRAAKVTLGSGARGVLDDDTHLRMACREYSLISEISSRGRITEGFA